MVDRPRARAIAMEAVATIEQFTNYRLENTSRDNNPKVFSGANGFVFRLLSDDQPELALKLFRHADPKTVLRYTELAEDLSEYGPYLSKCALHHLPSTSGRTREPSYTTAITMPWITGKNLREAVNHDIVERLYRPDHWFASLARMAGQLTEQSVIHGDLQSLNILVTNDSSLKLIDYDDLVLPGMRDFKVRRRIHEHLAPRCLQTDPNYADQHVDSIPLLSLLASIAGLSSNAESELIARYWNADRDDGGFLLTGPDLEEPDQSHCLRLLEQTSELAFDAVAILRKALNQPSQAGALLANCILLSAPKKLSEPAPDISPQHSPLDDLPHSRPRAIYEWQRIRPERPRPSTRGTEVTSSKHPPARERIPARRQGRKKGIPRPRDLSSLNRGFSHRAIENLDKAELSAFTTSAFDRGLPSNTLEVTSMYVDGFHISQICTMLGIREQSVIEKLETVRKRLLADNLPSLAKLLSLPTTAPDHDPDMLSVFAENADLSMTTERVLEMLQIGSSIQQISDDRRVLPDTIIRHVSKMRSLARSASHVPAAEFFDDWIKRARLDLKNLPAPDPVCRPGTLVTPAQKPGVRSSRPNLAAEANNVDAEVPEGSHRPDNLDVNELNLPTTDRVAPPIDLADQTFSTLDTPRPVPVGPYYVGMDQIEMRIPRRLAFMSKPKDTQSATNTGDRVDNILRIAAIGIITLLSIYAMISYVFGSL